MRPPPLSPLALELRSVVSILGTRVDNLSSTELLKKAASLFDSFTPAQLITANALLFQDMQRDPLLGKICASASLVVADGAGVSWAGWMMGEPPLFRYPGIDLAYDLCQESAHRNTPVFLLGGAPGVGQQAGKFLVKSIPGFNLAGVEHGFFSLDETDRIIDKIRSSGARFILVAIGMPKQDQWIFDHKASLPPGLYMGVGGTLDVWAGSLKRAPKIMRDWGLEWFFRLIQEPLRWRRMMGLPAFVWRVFRWKMCYYPRSQ